MSHQFPASAGPAEQEVQPAFRIAREWLRRHSSPRFRHSFRVLQRELPVRLVDIIPDVFDRWGLSGQSAPLPPAGLRRQVGGTSSRIAFTHSGEGAMLDFLRVLGASQSPHRRYPNWLDFGCGCGRVARHLVGRQDVRRFVGVDVDPRLVDWCRKHLPGEYYGIPGTPPTSFASNSFDVIYAGSVFTHLDETPQLAWLREIHRLLSPAGGLLIASTHSPELAYTRPDLSAAQRDQLHQRGFLFAAGGLGFNEDTAFHSPEYLLAAWGPLLGLERYECLGLNGYQDLHVWKKW